MSNLQITADDVAQEWDRNWKEYIIMQNLDAIIAAEAAVQADAANLLPTHDAGQALVKAASDKAAADVKTATDALNPLNDGFIAAQSALGNAQSALDAALRVLLVGKKALADTQAASQLAVDDAHAKAAADFKALSDKLDSDLAAIAKAVADLKSAADGREPAPAQ